MLVTVLQIVGMAAVEINLNTHTQKKHTILSLVILVSYMLVIRCYQIAWRAILANTNKRQAK